MLLILDNLDVSRHRDAPLSAMLDQLVAGCARLTLLVTSRRSFYRGRYDNGHVVYRVPELRQSADQLFLQVGKRFLAGLDDVNACDSYAAFPSVRLSVCLSHNGFSFLVNFSFLFGSCGRLSWLNCQLSSAR